MEVGLGKFRCRLSETGRGEASWPLASRLVAQAPYRPNFASICAAVVLSCGLLAAVLALTASARAADAGALEAKLASARGEASSISAGLRESNARLYAAEGEAASAEAHEARLSGLLAEGQEHAAELSRELADTRQQLAAERARLRRSHHALATRLVAIYESGTPDATSVFLESGSYDDLVTQADYLREITEADSALAGRVEQVRNEVRRETQRVAELQRRAVAYDERLAVARDEISAVREAAQAAAAELAALSAGREAALGDLKGKIGTWVSEIQAARAAEARAATAAEAEEEVGRWLGGPYAIPTYIVMCESGGDYSALNPSSGAGGAYQIIPSTWELYGGKGEPQNASKAEQDRIAGEIWADSGTSAWVCG
ncbi:MAG: resuscitation-promoting factor RpfA [Solirubrobacterales bacterium]|jgi:septal ring factor EnvC (AmiA/AmiB activator)|nr:resuscitation-promoting factor RpfA [Solirubrobacterales bacterium]